MHGCGHIDTRYTVTQVQAQDTDTHTDPITDTSTVWRCAGSGRITGICALQVHAEGYQGHGVGVGVKFGFRL